MRACRFGLAILFATVLLAGAIAAAGPARAQADAELNALSDQLIALNNAGKYADAIPLAERYAEVAGLELDADWVVLSACNTAAGEKADAEALSGLARAFFYAKARALLVSHWYVSSEAAVKLTTGAFAELKANPALGRAEALRRSMAALIAKGRPDEAHPEYWAPFVLVGEGAR